MPKTDAIVTIDGPSGAGKSTISKMLAGRLCFTYLDTGAMYRAVGLKVRRSGISPEDSEALAKLLDETSLRLEPGAGEYVRVFLDNEEVTLDIRTAEMGMVASQVSAYPLVRAKLTALQRELGATGAIVAEGRDMGTVVFPAADYKFFLDASPEERAQRRCAQIEAKGQPAYFQDILAQIVKRDHDDSSRAHAPLKAADDAVIVDSSRMSPDEVVAFMLSGMDCQ